MSKLYVVLCLSSLCILSAGCAGLNNGLNNSNTVSTNSEKLNQYVTHSSGSIKMPPMKTLTLANGLKIHFIKDDRLPRVSINLLIGVGQRSESESLKGINALTSSLLDQGTEKSSATDLADRLGALGAEVDIKPGSDFVTISTDSLSPDADALLNILKEIVLTPAFKSEEIERTRSQVIAVLQKKMDNPGQYASQLFDEWMFLGHPYAGDEMGTIESVKKITRKDIVEHYSTWFRPGISSLAISGKFDESFEKNVMTAFAQWQPQTTQLSVKSSLQKFDKVEFKVVGKKGLKQAEIRMGQVGIPRGHEDFLTMRLVNEALGGSFGSRLNQVIRDDQGLTYSIYSYMDGRGEVGTFQINTFTKNSTVGKIVKETLRVFNDFVEKGISGDELEAAKNQLAGQFPRAIETSDRLAFNILALEYYGVPFSYLTNFNKNVRAIKLKDANAALKRTLIGNRMKVLVYADPEVEVQLK